MMDTTILPVCVSLGILTLVIACYVLDGLRRATRKGREQVN